MAKLAKRLDILPEDYEGLHLESLACSHCTLGCNVIRVISRGDEKLVLCGKKEDTQAMLNNQRARLGIPEPGVPLKG